MKNMKKGFTLVEMLIVVVIIGILAAAILPRLNGVQASARDTAREAALRDIATALDLYANAVWEYPTDTAKKTTEDLNAPLVTTRDYLKVMPTEPRKNTTFKFAGTQESNIVTQGNFWYMLIKRNGQAKQAFILASVVETVDKANATSKMVEAFTADNEITSMKLCNTVEIKKDAQDNEVSSQPDQNGTCVVKTNDQLRLVVAR